MDLSGTSFIEPTRSQENQPLLSVSQPTGITLRERLAQAHFIPRRLHLPSKYDVLILLWSLLVGAIYMIAKGGVNFAAAELGQQKLDFFHSYGISSHTCSLRIGAHFIPICRIPG